MLIRLIPSPSHPTVLFKLTFENLPGSLCNPPAWANQLAALACDDLEIPELLHALDRAVGVQSILEEVNFELAEQKIKCLFVDEEVEEWPMDEMPDLIRRLWSVIDDVNESAAEMERERKREEEEKERKKAQAEEEERARKQQQQQHQDEESLLPRTKRGHKKQRSLLMNLVSSLIPLSLNSPRTPRSLPTSSACSPAGSRDSSPVRFSQSERVVQCSSAPATLSHAANPPDGLHSRRPSSLASASFSSPLPVEEAPALFIPVPPPPPKLTPRALRRRARSTLVDSFRLFVLPELNQRIRSSTLTDLTGSLTPYVSEISSPYYSWVIYSMIKRADMRLVEVVREVKDELDELGKKGFYFGSWPLGILGATSFEAAGFSPSSLASPFGNEVDVRTVAETDSQSNADSETDTDSSSLHTPLSMTFGDPFVALPPKRAATTSWTEAPSITPGQTENGTVVSAVREPLHQPKPKLSLTVPHLSSPSCLSLPSPTAVSPTHATDLAPPTPLPASLASVLAEHAHLTSLHAHLSHLLLVTRTKTAAAKADVSAREGVLEVRGRRKAWLNHSHGGVSLGSRVSASSIGWAAPFRPSGLGRYVWSSEEWECDPFFFKTSLSLGLSPTTSVSPVDAFSMEYYPNPFESEGGIGVESSLYGHGYGHRKRRSSSETSVKLFPVCEEQEHEFDEEEGSEAPIKFAVPLSRHRFAPKRHVDIELDDDDEEEDGDAHEDIADALVDIDLAGLARLEDGLVGPDVEDYNDNDDVEKGVVPRRAMHPRLLHRASIAPRVVGAVLR